MTARSSASDPTAFLCSRRVYPRITPSGLLISCATPAASRPTLARRSLCKRRCCCSLSDATMVLNWRAKSPNSSSPPTAMRVSRSPAARRSAPACRIATGRATLRPR